MGWKWDDKKQSYVWDGAQGNGNYTQSGTTGEKIPNSVRQDTIFMTPGANSGKFNPANTTGYTVKDQYKTGQSQASTGAISSISNIQNYLNNGGYVASGNPATAGTSGTPAAATTSTSYNDLINELLNNISNTESFSYDPNKDASFQAYLSGMMNQGQTAMEDTMGQAAALTGGYGSSYATAAGSQAYNDMLEQAMANQAQFENNAYNRYQNDLQNQYSLLGMYQTQQQNEQSQDNWQAQFDQNQQQNEQSQENWENEFGASNPYTNTPWTENQWNMASYYLQNHGAAAAIQYINGLNLTKPQKEQMLAEIGSGVTKKKK